MSINFVTNQQLYQEVIRPVSKAKSSVWIGTADIKDMHVHGKRGVVPFLSTLNQLAEREVTIRLIHAREPGPNFRSSFDKYPGLIKNIERRMCPRVHFKHIIIDGKFAYSGSANLTGAGLGIKSEHRRNFEAGFITTDSRLVKAIRAQYKAVWQGEFCEQCKRKEFCKDPIV
jgi:phosphatidylserine/phosphatidylglycerophosphate/cardiolipin synthase-like enzyme